MEDGQTTHPYVTSSRNARAQNSSTAMTTKWAIGMLCMAVCGCTPTVQVQAPDKPIEINLNVNIEQRVKVSIDRDVQQSIKKNKDIF